MVSAVYEVEQPIPELDAMPGDFVVVVPGARSDESDCLVYRALPRGRLGHVLGAISRGSLRFVLSNPACLPEPPSELLERFVTHQEPVGL